MEKQWRGCRSFAKDLEELKNKRTEMNNKLEGTNSQITEAGKWIDDLEDRMVKITATEQTTEKRMKRLLGQQ